jgi:hypothetical protein
MMMKCEWRTFTYYPAYLQEQSRENLIDDNREIPGDLERSCSMVEITGSLVRIIREEQKVPLISAKRDTYLPHSFYVPATFGGERAE